jgi:hypothetical protein
MSVRPTYEYAASIIVVSFNTRGLLRDCLTSAIAECARLPEGVTAEIVVVDNASRDGSADMVEREFAREFAASAIPVRLIRSQVNLGFGAANNLAIEAAKGRYPVLLNSDAFLHPGALARAIEHMDSDPGAGIGGARLVGRDGEPQPSARAFHSIWGDALILAALPLRFPNTRIFAAPGSAWDNPTQPAQVDWVTGAFMILRREALQKAGLFDPAFFLYCEEVDLCRRVKFAGFAIHYWPDVVVTHLGGESSRQLSQHVFSDSEATAVLWRMRSTLLYYRKHHGAQVWLARWLEQSFFALRRLRNRLSRSPWRYARALEAAMMLRLMRQAWRDTNGGRLSPPRPW